MWIGIVADDLTGAADAVAPFAMRGLSAEVRLPWGHCECTIEALAFNTNTRDAHQMRPTLRASIHRRVVRHLLACKATVIYKKIDSTLRGYLRVELEGVRRELPERLAVICPAFPAHERTVLQGMLSVRGAAQTSVRAAFEYAPDDSVAELTIETVRKSAQHLKAEWDRLSAAGSEAVFCDALEQGDLEIIAEAILQQPERYLPVGSAGLTAALATRMPPGTEPIMSPTALRAPFCQGRVLVVVGSLNPVSRRQAALLAMRAGIQPVVLTKKMRGPESYYRARRLLEAQWDAGQRVSLVITMDTVLPDWQHSPMNTIFHSIGKNIRKRRYDAIILTGGETADLFYTVFGVSGMRICGEVQPGIVQGVISSGRVPGMTLLSKAGGFGDDETLARCVGLA
ncbi:MAG TPA: four-carbon acid sugar kinase family protein [Chthonomonadaceae bacterium]|nr:four-carbon acid sugar kinase family protein [Chthonomonadaceae bacterium]